jgi:hypothetical protein
MSNDHLEHGRNPEVSYEPRDLSARGIFAFLVALAVMTVLFSFMLRGFYDFLDRYEARHQTPASPLTTQVTRDTREVPPDARTKFPEPRLEVNERTQLNDFLIQQENQLRTYAYVDQQSGTVRIPIDQAMKLIEQRGLPVLPAGAAPQAVPKPGAGRGLAVMANPAGQGPTSK